MTANETKPGQRIGNVGTLDIRNATEEAVANIERIGNVGVILYSPETASLLTKLSIGNMGLSVEAPADAKVLTGQTIFNRDYFKNQSEPLNLVIVGQLIIQADVPEEDIEKGLDLLVASGQILCPENLMGVVQSKLRDFSGQIQVFDPSTRLVMGKLTIDESYLQSLDDGTELMVMGKIDLPQVLDDDLLGKRISRLQVMGKITCREENLQTLRSCLDEKAGAVKIAAIPAGFEPVDGSLVLDALTLQSLPGRKLYCSGPVQIAEDVEPDALNDAVEALVAQSLLICPVALKEVVAQKCDMLKTKAIFYEGELWLVDESQELLSSRFDFLEGKATLVVRDSLTISADIDPKLLAERLAKVHNLEEIFCTPGQMGAIQARLGLNQGQLIDSTREEEEKDGNRIGNIGHLKL